MKRPALNWNDRKACEAWLLALDAAAQDVIAAGEDQVKAPRDRELGRRTAREIIAGAGRSIESMLAYAARGLEDDDGSSGPDGDDAPPWETGDPAGNGEAGPVH